MATFVKLRSGRWQAKVRKAGISCTKTFVFKKDAQHWAKCTEIDISTGKRKATHQPTFNLLSDVLKKHADDILPYKKAPKSGHDCINALTPDLGRVKLQALTSQKIAHYRDNRLKTVSGDTVRKELLFLKRVLTTAMNEWGLDLPHGNPALPVSLPKPNRARDRRPSKEELELLLDSDCWDFCLVAIETGMRRGEIANIQPSHIKTCPSTGVTTLLIPDTKTDVSRTIPLSPKAYTGIDSVIKRRFKANSITQLFNKVCSNLGIEDLRFHDLRHEATTRFFEMGLNIMEVSAITGHMDLKMLRRYTHLKAEDLALKLWSTDQASLQDSEFSINRNWG